MASITLAAARALVVVIAERSPSSEITITSSAGCAPIAVIVTRRDDRARLRFPGGGPAEWRPRGAHGVLASVSTENGWDMTERLGREEALHVGHASGANVFVAKILAKLEELGYVGGPPGAGTCRIPT
jgi:cysteine synthase